MRVDICSIMYNEEVLLPMWIEAWCSVPFIENIFLVDGGSTDRSAEIAKSYDRVKVSVVPWKNDFARQRNIAIKFAKSDWFIQPDIDEIPCMSPLGTLEEHVKHGANEIVLPYLKFYDWKTLWFFNDGNTPKLNNDTIHFGDKSTLTIFKKSHLLGYSKSLHEMPFFTGQSHRSYVKRSCSLSDLHNRSVPFLAGHYDQAKHFEQAKRNGTSVELEMGLKRARYRLITPATYEGKTYDRSWAVKATVSNDKAMMEELGAAQLKSFQEQHNIFKGYDASALNCDAVKKYATV